MAIEPKPTARWWRPAISIAAPSIVFAFGAAEMDNLIEGPIWLSVLVGLALATPVAAGFVTVAIMNHRKVPLWRFVLNGVGMSIILAFALAVLLSSGCGSMPI